MHCFSSVLIGKKVLRLEYDVYVSMAEKQLHGICSDIRKKWSVCKIALVHRSGYVLLCEHI